jgi:hexulose-6-phosphate isomerase
MDRRRFLTLTAPAVSAVACTPTLAAPARDTAGRRFRKGIMWGTVAAEGSVLDKMQAIQAAGFHGIELNSHMDWVEVQAALKETGLEVPSVCNDRHWKTPLSAPDPAVRAAGLAALERTLRDARAYGADSILLVPGVVNKETTYEECWDRSLAGIRQVLPLAEELGVRISIENVWNNFITGEAEAVRYLEAINSRWVGWHFDCGNIIRYGDPIAWIKTLGRRIHRVHIKEYSRDAAMRSGDVGKGFDVPLLKGANNWPGIMRALEDIGYQGYLITEQGGSLADLSAALDTIIAS